MCASLSSPCPLPRSEIYNPHEKTTEVGADDAVRPDRDLLTRHETTHDRDDQAQGRPVIRRSDRAAEACLNCAASKAKCDDQKPCGRCRSKSLVCQTATRKTLTYGTPREGALMPLAPFRVHHPAYGLGHAL